MFKAALVGLLAFSSGCSGAPYIWASEVPAARAQPAVASKKIGRGDVVAITVVGQVALSGTQTVGADGSVVIPDLGTVPLDGTTVEQANARIEQRLLSILQSPKVSVVVVTRMIEVSLLGEVRTPGKYALQSGDGVANAIALAGGLTEYANSSAIYLIRSGEPYRIRFRMKSLLRGGDSARAFALRDGDILLVE